MELPYRVQPLVIDVRAVVAAQILQQEHAPAAHEYRVHSRGQRVVQDDVVLIGATDGVLVGGQVDPFPRERPVDEDQDGNSHSGIIAANEPRVNDQAAYSGMPRRRRVITRIQKNPSTASTARSIGRYAPRCRWKPDPVDFG